MRTVLVANPRAAGGRCKPRLESLLPRLGEVECTWTEGPGHATELARRAAEQGARRVVAVGGDGTLFEVVNGLFEAPGPRPALGLLPLGTGNSFARDFGLHETEPAVRALLRDERRPVDVVRVVHRGGVMHYVNLLSVGFTAAAGALTNRRFKALGPAGYVLAVIASIARLSHPRFPLALDEQGLDDRACTFISFSNTRYTGGTMMMAPEADPSDGCLDVVRVGTMGRRRLLGCFPRIFRGTHTELGEVDVGTARAVRFALDGPVDVMVDGEVLTLHLEALEVLPRVLELVS